MEEKHRSGAWVGSTAGNHKGGVLGNESLVAVSFLPMLCPFCVDGMIKGQEVSCQWVSALNKFTIDSMKLKK